MYARIAFVAFASLLAGRAKAATTVRYASSGTSTRGTTTVELKPIGMVTTDSAGLVGLKPIGYLAVQSDGSVQIEALATPVADVFQFTWAVEPADVSASMADAEADLAAGGALGVITEGLDLLIGENNADYLIGENESVELKPIGLVATDADGYLDLKPIGIDAMDGSSISLKPIGSDPADWVGLKPIGCVAADADGYVDIGVAGSLVVSSSGSSLLTNTSRTATRSTTSTTSTRSR
jgi:hypothetical protein